MLMLRCSLVSHQQQPRGIRRMCLSWWSALMLWHWTDTVNRVLRGTRGLHFFFFFMNGRRRAARVSCTIYMVCVPAVSACHSACVRLTTRTRLALYLRGDCVRARAFRAPSPPHHLHRLPSPPPSSSCHAVQRRTRAPPPSSSTIVHSAAIRVRRRQHRPAWLA